MPSLLRKGSSKDVYSSDGDDGNLIFKFSDRVSILDLGPIPVEFPDLGLFRCAISACLFEELEKAGFETHFVRRGRVPDEMIVKSFEIPELGFSHGVTSGRLLPLEFLDRFVVTDKLMARMERGEIDRAEVEKLLQGGSTLSVGSHLRPAIVECSTKWQAADTYVSDKEAAVLAGITLRDLRALYDDSIRPATNFLRHLFREAGFEKRDGKTEGALDNQGRFIIVDSISPDELRLVDEDGNRYDKDPLRWWYLEEHPNWVARVLAAKKAFPNDKGKWPTYEAVPPQEVIKKVVDSYYQVAVAIKALSL